MSYLAQLGRHATLDDWDIDRVAAFLIACRAAIEDRFQKVDYPILHFYANWTAHPRLSKDPFCHQVLERAATIIADYDRARIDTICEDFGNLLSFESIRIESIRLLKALGLRPTSLEGNARWVSFQRNLAITLIERPIQWSDHVTRASNAKASFDRMKANLAGTEALTGDSIESLSLEEGPYRNSDKFAVPPLRLFFRVGLRRADGVVIPITGPIHPNVHIRGPG